MTLQEATSLELPRRGNKILCHIVDIEGVDHKNCTECGQYKALNHFAKRNSVIGYVAHCKECKEVYRLNNPHLKESLKIYFKNNKEAIDKRTKEYREKNKVLIQERRKEFYEENKERLSLEKKANYQRNKESYKQRAKEYYQHNKVGKLVYRKQYYEENKEDILAKSSEYVKENRNKINARVKLKMEIPSVNILQSLRNRIRAAVKRIKAHKLDRSQNLIGCTARELQKYLESLWLPGMTWGNYGTYKRGGPMTWHIDHIRPCASFDLTSLEQQKTCFHYTNLQPLWAVENIRKGARI